MFCDFTVTGRRRCRGGHVWGRIRLANDTLLERILNKKTTRRDFLKTAAKATAALAVGATALNLLGCTSRQERKGELTGLPLPKSMLAVDTARCTGCGRCETACSLALTGLLRPGVSGIHVQRALQFGPDGPALNYRYGPGLLGSGALAPQVCRQCRAPLCANICPQQAIRPNKHTGARTVDSKKCSGCGECVKACPWGAIVQDPESGLAVKCITCGACVEACPTGALALADWQDL